ncbi:MAG: multicopper oxidase domain-containing protein [Phycisphaeraceae bacterium]|nr:MAG: multicopper oxidase domain-containing protein [Phycisphaeraceae bacterium]
MPRCILALLWTVVFGVVSGGWEPARGDVRVVYVYNFEFSVNPDGGPIVDAVVTVGDTVRWVWQSGNHTTTSVMGSAESWNATIAQGSPVFEKVFTVVGKHNYYCLPHGVDNGDGTATGMSGTITVRPAGVGACCLPNGSCVSVNEASCLMMGGEFQGVGVGCDPSPCGNQPVTVVLPASHDAVLYETAGGTSANGAGQYLFAGNLSTGARRRSVVRFDVSGLPSGIEVLDASVELFCSQSQGSAYSLVLHRVVSSWGEGSSDPTGNEASGTLPTTNDATWVHRFYPGTMWTTPGGDYQEMVHSTAVVSGSGAYYAFAGPMVVSDVQSWADGEANHGWLVRGDEATSANGKRFTSRQAGVPAESPRLVVTYRMASTGACCLPNGSCVELTASRCVSAGGEYRGDGTMCDQVGCPVVLTPFVDALPRPGVAAPVTGQPGGAAHYEMAMTEQYQVLHRDLPATRVWGYAGSYPGPTIEAFRGEPVTVRWRNDLRVAETGALREEHVLMVDECLHGPDVTGSVPVAVVHLHGGKVDPGSDGPPEAAFAPGGSSPVYVYPNDQPAGTLWYHDHALGITRLNVYMGMAGLYLLRDPVERSLDLPGGAYEVPLVIQDRSFNADGSLRYPGMWMDHFFGDTVLVNGKVWPYLEVDRGKYRLRLLNGSNSRAYTLSLSDGSEFWQIGTDLGLLESPVGVRAITLTPGERAEVVVDFGGYAPGSEVILTNTAPAPYPSGPAGSEIPLVMKFVVGPGVGHTSPLPAVLAEVPRIEESEARRHRAFELAIAAGHCPGHHGGMWMINGLGWDEITEYPRLGTTEVWAWVNRSSVAHPMHMHLVSFRVLDRQDFDVVTGEPTGPRVAPGPGEAGWKDTVAAYPGQITRVIARFEGFAGEYPYHCHILEHEDHEMMRRFVVVCPADFNTDGFIDFFDLDAYAACFEGGECPAGETADFNGDGFVDFFDLDAYIGAFEGGC